MLKWLGAFMVVFCSCCIGADRVLHSRQRIRSLNALLDGLNLLRCELETDAPAMPKLLERLSQNAPQPAAELFGAAAEHLRKRELPFSVIWEIAVRETDSLLLRAEERQALLTLGQVLGKSGTEAQCREVQRTEARLKLFLELEQGERLKRNRVYAAVGAGTGLMLAIMLL